MRWCSGVPWRGVRQISKSQIRWSSTRNKLFRVHEEVEHAIQTGKPVVALETTIYTHGFPYPENVALASRLESLVRAHGGVPATIGILNGQAHVGMDPEELIELVSTAGSKDTWKISRRDLGFIGGLGALQGQKINGGTTISGTMILAHLAGIKIFATGGLGGVHRGGENSMDISADLTELGRTPVCVVSSGCKSFLDLPRTLEFLETQGVGVATFADGRDGQVDFPGFFSRDSGIKSPRTIQNEQDAAAIVHAQFSLPVHSGLLFANPVPEDVAMKKEEINSIIEQAVAEAESQGVTGAANTPFVLKRIREISNGASVTANRALIEANVIRGTKVAVELARLENDFKESPHLPTVKIPAINKAYSSSDQPRPLPAARVSGKAHCSVATKSKQEIDILVIGALAMDTACDYTPTEDTDDPLPVKGVSNPAKMSHSAGGVGRNVATAAQYAGAQVSLASVVADDPTGKMLMGRLEKDGLDLSNMLTMSGAVTAQYIAVNSAQNDLQLGMADFSIFQQAEIEQPDYWEQIVMETNSRWIVVDANWSPKTISKIVKAAQKRNISVAFEPVSAAKAGRLFRVKNKHDFVQHVSLATPNVFELIKLHQAATVSGVMQSEEWWHMIDSFGLSSAGSRDKFLALGDPDLVERGIPQQIVRLLPLIPNLVVNLGPQGSLLTMVLKRGDPRLRDMESAPHILARTGYEDGDIGGVYMRLFPPPDVVAAEDVVSVNGVGDTMLGVLVAGLAKTGKSLDELLPLAQRAAALTLKSKESVSPAVREVGFV